MSIAASSIFLAAGRGLYRSRYEVMENAKPTKATLKKSLAPAKINPY